MSRDLGAALAAIHADIDRCQVCHEVFPGLTKPARMDRGGPSQLMVVGEAPGNNEVQSELAFSGQAGKRLMQWLKECGIEAPRGSVYFTSAAKCASANKSHLRQMTDRCQVFLGRQISTLRPSVIISLGELAYTHIRADDVVYASRVNVIYHTSEVSLLTKFDCHYWHVTWPHPSPLNRQLNEQAIKDGLRQSQLQLKSLLEKSRGEGTP